MAKEPIHIPSQSVPSGKSQREQELEDTIRQWSEAYNTLKETVEYNNSLSDDRIFRAELLNSINQIAVLFSRLLQKIEETAK